MEKKTHYCEHKESEKKIAFEGTNESITNNCEDISEEYVHIENDDRCVKEKPEIPKYATKGGIGNARLAEYRMLFHIANEKDIRCGCTHSCYDTFYLKIGHNHIKFRSESENKQRVNNNNNLNKKETRLEWIVNMKNNSFDPILRK